MIADYVQSRKPAQCAKFRCHHCGEEIDCVLFTEWGYKVWDGREWVDERSSRACEKIRELEDMKTKTISGIWTADTMSQALSIFNNVKQL